MTKKDRLEELADYYDTHDLTEGTVPDDWEPVVPEPSGDPRMTGYSIRLPAAVLEEARQFAETRGMTTGAWLREVIEAAIATAKSDNGSVPISVLLAAVEEYQHRRVS